MPNQEIVIADLTAATLHKDFMWAKHILLNPQATWDIYSGFHKSLRSGLLPLAYNWGKLLLLKTRESTVRKYLRKVTFEETRSLNLYYHLHSDCNILTLIQLFARSKKKWALGYLQNHFSSWNQGYSDYLSKKQRGVTFDYDRDHFQNIGDLSGPGIYELNYWLQDRKDLEDKYLRDAKASNRDSRIRPFIESKHPDFGSSYYRMVLLEMMNGLWESEANDYSPPEDPAFFVPAKRAWYFDVHTRSASKVIKASYHSMRPGPHYKHLEIDLRLSGMIVGVGHRFKVVDPLSKTWSEVTWSDSEWRQLYLHEQRFYPV